MTITLSIDAYGCRMAETIFEIPKNQLGEAFFHRYDSNPSGVRA